MLIAAAAAAFLGLSAPEPLDPDLACIIDRVPAASRASIVAEASTGAPGPARQAFRDATNACARLRGWAPAFATSAGMIAGSVVLGEEAGMELERGGVATALIDRWFDAQGQAFRTGPDVGNGGERLILQLEADGVPAATLQQLASQIGVYLGASMIIERIGAGLPID